MIHTLMISHRLLSIRDYNEIFRVLALISKENNTTFRKTNLGYETTALRDYGFNKVILKKFKVDKRYKNDYLNITIILNPIKLVNKDKLEVIKEEDLELVYKGFKEVKNRIFIGLPSLEYWNINRVDYAVNIFMEHVKEYIKLFQRADKPSIFNELYSTEAHRRKQLDGSFYLYNKSTIINFYDKENELMKKNFNTDGAKNLLRFEVQCNKLKTNNIKYKKGFETSHVKNYLKMDLSEEYIKHYYNKTIGSGDYYKLSRAIEMINDSNYTEKMKKRLIEVLKGVNLHRSIWKAREKSVYSKNSFNKYLKMIRALNINPVTIPNKWKIDYLKNPEKFFGKNKGNNNLCGEFIKNVLQEVQNLLMEYKN